MIPEAPAFKVLTHDLRSPLQGGRPIFDGTLPFELPWVKLDTSNAECAAGWNYCADLAEAFRIAGMWPTGRPAAVFRVAPSSDAITRGKKSRASSLTLIERASRDDILNAIEKLSVPFGKHASAMAVEQIRWFDALARPRRNVRDVERGLRAALKARGLDWKLHRFGDARAARDAWAARAARATRAAQDARAARDARAAWDAWAAQDARAAWDAWAARAARATWAARAARDAWAALTVHFAALKGWIDHDPMLLTTGIRDAYEAGLELAIPTAESELGFAMKEGSDD